MNELIVFKRGTFNIVTLRIVVVLCPKYLVLIVGAGCFKHSI